MCSFKAERSKKLRLLKIGTGIRVVNVGSHKRVVVTSLEDSRQFEYQDLFLFSPFAPELYEGEVKRILSRKRVKQGLPPLPKHAPVSINLFLLYELDGKLPVQLTANGLAVLSFLKAQKGGDPLQPMISTSRQDLVHLLDLMHQDSVPIGTKVPVIFQNTTGGALFNRIGTHKLPLYFEKSEKGVQIYCLDEHIYGTLLMKQLLKFDLVDYSKKTQLFFYSRKGVRRQHDGFQCGTFAFKATRGALRENFETDTILDTEYRESIEGNSSVSLHKIDRFPNSQYRAIQSQTGRQIVLSQIRHLSHLLGAMPTKRGRTLAKHFERYEDPAAYALKFSRKYAKEVKQFFEEHSKSNPKVIADAIKAYSLKDLTLEQLLAYNAAHQRALQGRVSGYESGLTTYQKIHWVLAQVYQAIIRIFSPKKWFKFNWFLQQPEDSAETILKSASAHLDSEVQRVACEASPTVEQSATCTESPTRELPASGVSGQRTSARTR